MTVILARPQARCGDNNVMSIWNRNNRKTFMLWFSITDSFVDFCESIWDSLLFSTTVIIVFVDARWIETRFAFTAYNMIVSCDFTVLNSASSSVSKSSKWPRATPSPVKIVQWKNILTFFILRKSQLNNYRENHSLQSYCRLWRQIPFLFIAHQRKQ